MGMSGARITVAVTALAGALLLSGCTGGEPTTGPSAPADAAPATSSAAPSSEESSLSAFEQQLPLSGDFVSQQTGTTGSVRIERRTDGSTWAVLTGFSTGDASDLRLSLKEGALEQDESGDWVDTAGYSFEIAALDPDRPDQEIPIPGAATMPEIRTLTVMDYQGPDYPSLGSVALAP
ncbi:hypothetical protein C5C94_07220 [Rathayibacter sp. AY1C3]|nr:hypothetical protein C5B92_15075 [Rathayibacter sp. AY1A4]PPG81524.1 hypothetical protein C5C52_08965 [Rathayibacter sp. AY1E5]PPG90506.1 hypothetical protein C5C39_10180 [Rathayibacter sp. AY1F3]PPH32220.1 hypothetical protein C5C94_07220 [Rathayibacter sp. AY1C3]PPH66326.1 hypothetical protein C5D25_01590 [Rathayibacter sp. AY1D7]